MNPEWEDGKAESLALAPDPVRADRSAAPRASLAQDATPAPMPDNLFALALCNLPHGVCMFDETRHLILCNPAYARLYQLPERLTRPGTTLQSILNFRRKAGSAPADMTSYFDVVDMAKSRGEHAGTRVRLVDGRTIQITHKPLGEGGYVACHEDITASIEAERHIRYLAAHDAMTGLPNRVSLAERMNRELARGRRRGFAVLCLDLDQFKVVNDTLGHLRGDSLLKAVTARFLACCAETDLVARLGGDEFVVLQIGIDRPAQASALASRLIEAISRPFDLDDDQVTIGLSVGIAFFPNDGRTADELLHNADVALYRAKLDGRNTFRFFEPAMDNPLQLRRRLELDLRGALARGEFRLHYQPLIESATGAILGFEALLRWTHPERGTVPPLDFIPLCEETGLIVPLGEWVLRRACLDAAAWPDAIKVAVNLSAVQFKGGRLCDMVRSVLATTGLAPNRLELEITESVLLIESERTLQTLHDLRSLGVTIALDDFGTGYSSLSYLRSFPFDKIKIDRSFVSAGTRSDCDAIVNAVASLGAALNMVTTAEGVETEAQFQRMRAHGCTEAQGYLFGRPCPAEDVLALLRATIADTVWPSVAAA